MKSNLVPVILTAALTSVGTIFAVKQFSKSDPVLWDSSRQLPVNYVSYSSENGPVKGAPVDFRNAAESSVKAVVHIKTTINSRTVVARDPFAEMFGDNYFRQYRTPEQMGSGSGVVISPDGYIVTNNHVVNGADVVTVTFNDRNTRQAKVIGTDPSTDIAILKIDEKNLPFMEFGNSDDVHLGEWVLAVGYPLSLDATVTAGIVSAKGRTIGAAGTRGRSAIESFIQTDAAVNPGNSGGPLVNATGQLIGINSAIASLTGSYTGYSYAIPANIVKKAAADIIQYGTVQRGFLGIEPRDFKYATPDEIKTYKLTETEGVFVAGVSDKGGAKAAGIQKGDFITAINSSKVTTIPELNEQVARYKPGDHISVTYLRNGREQSTSVELKNINGTTDVVKDEVASPLTGASLGELSAAEKRKYGIEAGITVKKVGEGLLAKARMRDGYIITGINGNPVNTVTAVEEALSSRNDIQLEGFYPDRNGMYYYNIPAR
ncbi:trypsin-like peptidase domain-containing protein [Rurimicrobium arvi]|uniref:Trypsin-like peptidase domain-containing protein n=1 Tax=Rurimicrobium arvi TaxID=2049916 RepID=A0ABP8MYJ1_9BACT